MKKRRDGCNTPRGSRRGSQGWISSRSNQRRRSPGAHGFVSFMPCQSNSLWSPNVLFTWISKKNQRGGRVMEGGGAGIEKPQHPWNGLEDFCVGLETLLLQLDSRPWTKANKEKTNMSLKVTCWHVSMSQPKFITQARRSTWEAWPSAPIDGVFLGNLGRRYLNEVKASKEGKTAAGDPRTEAAKKINLCFVMLEADIITENLVWVGMEENGYRIWWNLWTRINKERKDMCVCLYTHPHTHIYNTYAHTHAHWKHLPMHPKCTFSLGTGQFCSAGKIRIWYRGAYT